MKVLVIDPGCSGIAGNLLLASLIDLTGEREALDPLAGAIRDLRLCREFHYGVETVDAGEAVATCLTVDIRGEDGGGSRGLLEAAARATEDAGLSPGARSRALAAIGDLAAVGAGHVVAPAGTIFSVAGTMLLLDRAGLLSGRITAMPTVLGGGTIKTGSGGIPGPRPATLEILARHRFPFSSAPADAELTTPTGAALLAALAEAGVSAYPAMVPVRVGYGIRAAPKRSGLLRVVEGESLPPGEDRMVMLETNLDDVSGEAIGYAVERLFAEGAVDVFVTPAFGKKNRPVSVVSVMAAAAVEDRLVRILMEETGTLGVRVHEFRKVIADRHREEHLVSLGGREYPVRVKISTANGRLIAEKPEYEDLAAIARDQALPLRFVNDEVRLYLSRRREHTASRGGAGGGCPPDRPNVLNAARDE